MLASGLLRLMRLSRIVRLGKLKKFAAFLRATEGWCLELGQISGAWHVSPQNVSKLGSDFKDFWIVDPEMLQTEKKKRNGFKP